MSGYPKHDDTDAIDLCGRIMLTHALDPLLAERALGITAADARAMIACGRLSSLLKPDQWECLALLTNILVRLEIICRSDTHAIRWAIHAPLDALGGAAPAERFARCPDALRAIRAAIDHVDVPRIRWWRVGH